MKENDENDGGKLIFEDKAHLKEKNLETLSQKLKKEKKVMKAKLEEIEKKIQQMKSKNKIK